MQEEEYSKGEKEEYFLEISAGPDENHLEKVAVNCEELPIFISNQHFSGYILVRVRDYCNGPFDDHSKSPADDRANGPTDDRANGPAGDCANGFINTHNQLVPTRPFPKSTYFQGRNRRYSIVIQGKFKETWDGDQVVFGVDSNRPLAPLPGIGLGLRICKWLDPALEAKLDGPEPHLYTPLVSAMKSLGIFDKIEFIQNDLLPGSSQSLNQVEKDHDFMLKDVPSDVFCSTTSTGDLGPSSRPLEDVKQNSLPNLLQHDNTMPINTNTTLRQISSTQSADKTRIDIQEMGPFHFSFANVPERSLDLFPTSLQQQDTLQLPNTYEKRKKVFGSLEKRQLAQITSQFTYCMDFCDQFFELSDFTIKLPGFSLNCFKYWDGVQPLRYRCLTRDQSVVFFCVQFQLVRKGHPQ